MCVCNDRRRRGMQIVRALRKREFWKEKITASRRRKISTGKKREAYSPPGALATVYTRICTMFYNMRITDTIIHVKTRIFHQHHLKRHTHIHTHPHKHTLYIYNGPIKLFFSLSRHLHPKNNMHRGEREREIRNSLILSRDQKRRDTAYIE